MEIGFITKHNSTCRFICEAIAGQYIAAFMLKYCLILEKETLEPLQKVSYARYNIYGVVQGGCLAFDKPEITISFYDAQESTSRVYFIKFTPTGTGNETARQSVIATESMTSIAAGSLLEYNKTNNNDNAAHETKVVDLIHLMPHPITFSQSLNITVAFEYAPGKLIFGMDEPGYLLADKNSGDQS